MSDQRDRSFVQHSIDTGLESMQGNPFLAQRIMNQERTEQPVMKKKISFAFILAMVLLIVCVATAVAGATNEDFNTLLYQLWPEAALKLMPVNISCEDKGIQMEVLSALAEGQDITITFSLQDLEGSRINEHTRAEIDIDYDLFDNCTGCTNSFSPAYYIEKEDRACFVDFLSFDTPSLPRNGQVRAYTDIIWPQNYSATALLPLLKEYGSHAGSMPVPENAVAYGGYTDEGYCITLDSVGDSRLVIPDSMRVLDNQSGPEIRLADNVFLSGIGMIDGLLHVQVHYKDLSDVQVTDESGSNSVSYYPWDVWITLRDPDEEDSVGASKKYRQESRLPNGLTSLYWEKDGKEGWEEQIFTIDTGLTEEQVFIAEVTETLNPIYGHWEVSFPMRLIKSAN